MSYSATRLTLYSLISAVESDLRAFLTRQFGIEKDVSRIIGQQLAEKCFERLKKDCGDAAYVSCLAEMADYLDFSDTYQVLNANSANLSRDIADSLKALTSQLDKLVPIRNRVCHSRPLNFDDLAVTLDILDSLERDLAISWENVKRTKTLLAENPASVLNEVIPTSPDDSAVFHNLPIPDFDETGFIGRRSQVDQLLKLIQGPYPVITIVGEGGLGKTALALKVAYEVVDTLRGNFDSVVWSSAKSATVTAQEIVRIENAITDSLGMFKAISAHLAGNSSSDPLAEILSYLKEFRILLVLDNLETVIDKGLSRFFEQLPTGSKVLLTSRIGIGEFERRLKLDPLEERDSVQLLRCLAKTRNIQAVATAPPNELRTYCRRMKNNPGFIKWFVAAVQAGGRPEQILDQPGIFLDFCMSNVFDYLNSSSKRVLQAMQCVPTPLSQAELVFLTDMEPLQLQAGLHQLLATNMVLMSSIGGGIGSESKYVLAELAREYLTRNHAVKEKDFGRFRRKQQELREAGNLITADNRNNSFSIYSIRTRSRSDIIVAKYLLDALRAAMGNRITDAQEQVNSARSLAPQFYEVHRVEAWIHVKAGNIPAAEASYETAVELEPRSAELRYWFAGFLARYAHDNERALDQLMTAAELAPNQLEIKLEIARSYMFLHKYGDAQKVLDAFATVSSGRAWLTRKVHDIQLQLLHRQADFLLHQHDHVSALEKLECFADKYEISPLEVRDTHIADTLSKALSLAYKVRDRLLENEAKERAIALVDRLKTELEGLGLTTPQPRESRKKGIIRNLPPQKNFGFLVCDQGESYFFHFQQIKPGQRDFLREGAEIWFEVGHNAQGRCAVNCSLT